MKSEQQIITKIRGLLAKAESTDFEEEAAACVAKAQELIARYSIDHLLVDAWDEDSSPTSLEILLDAPYIPEKASLVHHIAKANHCRSVWSQYPPKATVFGFESDLEMVELLFASLLVQGAKALGMASKPIWVQGSELTIFKRSFWRSYALRIGDRLSASAAAVENEHESLLPVLRRRDDEVEAAVAEAFPNLRTTRSRATYSSHGWVAGQVAADSASIDIRNQIRQQGRLGA